MNSHRLKIDSLEIIDSERPRGKEYLDGAYRGCGAGALKARSET